MFAVGNILNRAHNYFQDFWKHFSIFNKAQQLQLNRKRKQIRKRERGRSPPGPYLCWPGPPGLCQSSPTSASRQRRVAGACSRGHLLLPPPAASSSPSERHGDAQHLPALIPSLPLVSLTLSHDGRARSSPPFALDVTRATPSPLRQAQ